MITENTPYSIAAGESIGSKALQFWQLMKFRLTSLVVFSGCFGYFLAVKEGFSWGHQAAFVAGSYLVTAAANTINQILEKDLDKLMARTLNRPLPTGRLSVREAVIFTLVTVSAGSVILFVWISPLVAGLSLFSLILYAFVYTPMKQVSPISVLIGAFPGAMPPLIGWAAMHGSISIEAWIIFGIQFIWQFPHFWAIAWLGDEDYRKAGFKMLPSSGGKDFMTAFQMTTYTLFLIPLGLLPAKVGITGMVSAMVAVACAALFLYQSYLLMKNGTRKDALGVMFGSFIYLPVVQLAYLFDKI
jgi:protoheme IX farnesyltransferase